MTNQSPFRIRALRFNDGSDLQLANVTIFVGPNNSGKSRALRDAVNLIQPKGPAGIVVTQAAIDGPDDWDGVVDALSDRPNINADGSGYDFSTIAPSLSGLAQGRGWGPGIDVAERISAGLANSEQRPEWLKQFMHVAMAHLTTDTRLTLLNDTGPARDARRPENLVHYFYFCGTETEKIVADTVERFFNNRVRLDFSDPGRVRMRYASDFSDVPPDPRDAIEPMQRKLLLSDQGDGVRSFTAMVSAIEALDRSIYVIDEPEAFLHPPQAFHIGRLIGERASSRKQFVIATHSSDFLRGVISATEDVTVVRIKRDGDTNSIHPIETPTLRAVTTDPLLSSSKVLEALFYDSAVVVEADSDARFFASAFARIEGELDTHFVAADNKQTVAKILALYAEMGIKRLGIVDFDMLRVRQELANAMEALSVPDDSRDRIQSSRDKIADEANTSTPDARVEAFRSVLSIIDGRLKSHARGDESSEDVLSFLQKRASEAANVTKPWNELKRRGRDGLPDDLQSVFDVAYSELLRYGLCVYPLGELESSLDDLGLQYTTNKKEWIVSALRLVPNLTVNTEQQFWKIIAELVSNIA